MRHRATVIAVLLAASIVGCGSSSDQATTKPEQAPASESAPEPAEEAPVEKTLELGEPAETIGSGGAGALQLTPDTIVYVDEATGETPDNDLFAVVAVKLQPTNAVAAAPAAPIDGGGWSWITPDGEAIQAGAGDSAFNVTPDRFSAAGEIQPGTHEWTSAVFDLTDTQRGGTLMYVDGEGTAYRWTTPAQDDGPQTDKLKQALQ